MDLPSKLELRRKTKRLLVYVGLEPHVLTANRNLELEVGTRLRAGKTLDALTGEIVVAILDIKILKVVSSTLLAAVEVTADVVTPVVGEIITVRSGSDWKKISATLVKLVLNRTTNHNKMTTTDINSIEVSVKLNAKDSVVSSIEELSAPMVWLRIKIESVRRKTGGVFEVTGVVVGSSNYVD